MQGRLFYIGEDTRRHQSLTQGMMPQDSPLVGRIRHIEPGLQQGIDSACCARLEGVDLAQEVVGLGRQRGAWAWMEYVKRGCVHSVLRLDGCDMCGCKGYMPV